MRLVVLEEEKERSSRRPPGGGGIPRTPNADFCNGEIRTNFPLFCIPSPFDRWRYASRLQRRTEVRKSVPRASWRRRTASKYAYRRRHDHAYIRFHTRPQPFLSPPPSSTSLSPPLHDLKMHAAGNSSGDLARVLQALASLHTHTQIIYRR